MGEYQPEKLLTPDLTDCLASFASKLVDSLQEEEVSDVLHSLMTVSHQNPRTISTGFSELRRALQNHRKRTEYKENLFFEILQLLLIHCHSLATNHLVAFGVSKRAVTGVRRMVEKSVKGGLFKETQGTGEKNLQRRIQTTIGKRSETPVLTPSPDFLSSPNSRPQMLGLNFTTPGGNYFHPQTPVVFDSPPSFCSAFSPMHYWISSPEGNYFTPTHPKQKIPLPCQCSKCVQHTFIQEDQHLEEFSKTPFMMSTPTPLGHFTREPRFLKKMSEAVGVVKVGQESTLGVSEQVKNTEESFLGSGGMGKSCSHVMAGEHEFFPDLLANFDEPPTPYFEEHPDGIEALVVAHESSVKDQSPTKSDSDNSGMGIHIGRHHKGRERRKCFLDDDSYFETQNSSQSQNQSAIEEEIPRTFPPKKKRLEWKPEETERLKALVTEYGQKNWLKISAKMKEAFPHHPKTRSQCAQHWHRVCSTSLDKGPWNFDEGTNLQNLIESHTTIKWAEVAMGMRKLGYQRSDAQCRYQYQKMKKAREIPWRDSEYQYMGNKMVEYSESPSFIPNLESNQIWVTLAEGMKKQRIGQVARDSSLVKKKWGELVEFNHPATGGYKKKMGFEKTQEMEERSPPVSTKFSSPDEASAGEKMEPQYKRKKRNWEGQDPRMEQMNSILMDRIKRIRTLPNFRPYTSPNMTSPNDSFFLPPLGELGLATQSPLGAPTYNTPETYHVLSPPATPTLLNEGEKMRSKNSEKNSLVRTYPDISSPPWEGEGGDFSESFLELNQKRVVSQNPPTPLLSRTSYMWVEAQVGTTLCSSFLQGDLSGGPSIMMIPKVTKILTGASNSQEEIPRVKLAPLEKVSQLSPSSNDEELEK